jgi:hypothetical protein
MHLRGIYFNSRVPHGACTSWGVYLMGMHLMGMHLMGMYLMDIHLMDIHLKGVAKSMGFFFAKTKSRIPLFSWVMKAQDTLAPYKNASSSRPHASW